MGFYNITENHTHLTVTRLGSAGYRVTANRSKFISKNNFLSDI